MMMMVQAENNYGYLVFFFLICLHVCVFAITPFAEMLAFLI